LINKTTLLTEEVAIPSNVPHAKLAGYHWTFGQIEQKASYDELLAYHESGGTAPPPDGYTPPFHKANREAEYRQAHAIFSEQLRKARADGGTR
jgi:hypothetical protein